MCSFARAVGAILLEDGLLAVERKGPESEAFGKSVARRRRRNWELGRRRRTGQQGNGGERLREAGREGFGGVKNGGCLVEEVGVTEDWVGRADAPGGEVGGESGKKSDEE